MPDPEVSCSQCGTTAATPPITWLYEVDSKRGPRYVCDRCLRSNLRSVEAKLEQQWW